MSKGFGNVSSLFFQFGKSSVKVIIRNEGILKTGNSTGKTGSGRGENLDIRGL
jgi:hypothetical protein